MGQVYRRVVHAFLNELEPHFQFEEVSLLPLLHTTATQPLVADHQKLQSSWQILLDPFKRAPIHCNSDEERI